MDFQRILTAQSKLMASWAGVPLDAHGVLRRLNCGGRQPPVFWIFNVADEPSRLAEALGPDQPVLFGRSLHILIAPGDPDRERMIAEMAAYYAGALAALPGWSGLRVGATCQGSGVALRAARALMTMGRGVSSVSLIAARPRIRTDLPALLIHGSRDPDHDPFRQDPVGAGIMARHCFRSFRRAVVDMAHREYSDEANVAILADLLQEFWAALPPDPRATARSTILES